MPEAVIVATARSPIGRAFKGSLTSIRPDELLTQIVSVVLAKVPALDPASIDDLIVGCGLPGGEQGFNIARVVAVLLGYDTLPGTTVNRYCSSSLQTTRMAYHAIKAGEGDVFISAGVECVSRSVNGSSDSWPDTKNPVFATAQERTVETSKAELLWHDPRTDGPSAPDTMADLAIGRAPGGTGGLPPGGQLPDVYIAMGETAENVAAVRGISRAEQDEFGVRSQNLAEKAIANGFWQREITPVTLPDGSVVSADDGPRPGTTLEKVATLKPAFREHGTVTAGNCCPLNDGAAALVVMSDVKAAQLGLTPLARIVSTGVSALSPEIMGLGPVEASRQALRRAGMAVSDVDLVEINEAFAAQVIPAYRDLGIDPARLNVNGGAIAVGHPFGMTGARIATTLLNSLQFHDKTIGLETMCVGGGQGMAMIFERLG